MTFLSSVFLLFFIVVFSVYYICPKKIRHIWLLLMSYVFYAVNDYRMIVILLFATGITYVGGKYLGKNPSKLCFTFFFCLNLSILFLFKYTDFILNNLVLILRIENLNLPLIEKGSLIAPVGLSFYIFQSTTYLGDIYRHHMKPEQNPAKYALFVAFFPTVMSGPIQKSRELLKEINNPKDFDYEQIRKGMLLFIWGYFEKVVVANRLAVIVNTVYDNFKNYDGIFYLAAAVCFSLYIYSDFSSYSDMACGIAKMMGFNLRRNFRNPYLAETITDFWKRWHMSLNSWFVEYVYIPLGGSRKGELRKYLNIMMVFLLSGAWHGASWHFIIWGGLNGLFQIIGEAFADIKDGVYKRVNVDRDCISVKFIRRSIVFLLITITWVLFRMPSTYWSFYFIKNMLLFQPVTIFNPDLLLLGGTNVGTLLTILSTCVFIGIQNCRKDERKYYCLFSEQPMLMQYLLLSFMVCVIIFSAVSGTSQTITQFIYFQF